MAAREWWNRTRRTPTLGVRMAPRDAVNVLGESARVVANLVDVVAFDAAAPGAATLTQDLAEEWMRRRLGVDPVFTRVLRRRFADLGDPFWVEDADLDVRDHIRVVPVTTPGWEPVETVVSRALVERMDLTTSGWEIVVLSGVRGVPFLPENATLVVVKVHHSAMDGLGIVSVVRALFSSAGPDHDGSVSTPRGGHRPEVIPPLWREVLTIAPRTASLVRSLRTHRAQLSTAHRTHRTLRPSTRFNARIGSRTRVAVWSVDLDRVRSIAAASPSTTVNDVLLTVVSSALSEYLAERNETPAGTLSATMPIDIASDDADAADAVAANRTTFVDVDLHTSVDDPRARRAAVHRSAAEAKDHGRRSASAPGLFDVAPAALLRVAFAASALLWRERPQVPSTTVVSNMPHGSDELTFLGAPAAAAFMPMPIIDGVGLVHHVTSLGRRLALTVSVDDAMMPDPEHYVQLLGRALEELNLTEP